jgi:hypothetical protein
LTYDPTSTHGLIVPSALTENWIAIGRKSQSQDIIGYCVLEKGVCGANLAIRHLANKEVQVQTSSDAEYNNFKIDGFSSIPQKTAPTFYLWGESDQLTAPQHSPVENKTTVLTRSWKLTAYHYATNQQEREVHDKASYEYDGTMGRIVAKKSDMPDCPDLAPITRLVHPHMMHWLTVDAAFVSKMTTTENGLLDMGIIGYGVSTKGKCGATVPVRHMYFKATTLQVTNAAEYAIYKEYGGGDYAAPTFYIWEA